MMTSMMIMMIECFRNKIAWLSRVATTPGSICYSCCCRPFQPAGYSTVTGPAATTMAATEHDCGHEDNTMTNTSSGCFFFPAMLHASSSSSSFLVSVLSSCVVDSDLMHLGILFASLVPLPAAFFPPLLLGCAYAFCCLCF